MADLLVTGLFGFGIGFVSAMWFFYEGEDEDAPIDP